MKMCSGESRRSTYCEEQSWDGSAAFHMNHGQQTGEVSLSGSSEEQSADRQIQWRKKKSFSVFVSAVHPHIK